MGCAVYAHSLCLSFHILFFSHLHTLPSSGYHFPLLFRPPRHSQLLQSQAVHVFYFLKVGLQQQHIFSFDRLLFKSLNTCISQLTCPHFRLAPLLTILSISNIRFHSWPFSSRPLQIIDITDIFCQDTIEMTDRAPFLQRFQHFFSVFFFSIRFDG